MNPWLIIDANYLCRRAYHALGDRLTHNDAATGTVFGFLRETAALQELFQTPRVAFCWDSGSSLRRQIYAGYKSGRLAKIAAMSAAERESLNAYHRQVNLLRNEYLYEIGYRNSHATEGYEADDVAAAICRGLSPNTSAIIVSADHDFYQCLNGDITIYNPSAKRAMTLQSFHAAWGLLPAVWPKVMAIAGCPTDDVPGIRGVGLKLAARYMRRVLPAHTKAYKAIKAGGAQIKRNLRLVTLPYPGLGNFALAEDRLDEAGWSSVCERLGFASMAEDYPLPLRRQWPKRQPAGFGI